MAISYVGEVKVPAVDDAVNSATTVTFTPPSMTSGDFVLVYVATFTGSVTWSVTTTGGQTWTEVFDETRTGSHALYWCVWDGTWAANPVFTRSGSAASVMGQMVVLRGVHPTTPWDVDPSARTAADTNDQDFLTFNTNTNGAWAVWGGFEIDNNTCTTNNGGAWSNEATTDVGWRVSTDLCMAWCRKYVASAGAAGATTLNYSANDAGGKWSGALKAGPTTTERAATFDVTTAAITAAATFYTTFTRAADVAVTQASITAAGVGWTTLERAATFDVTEAAITAAATHTHHWERAATLDGTADILVVAEIIPGEAATERAAALDAEAAITVAGARHSKFQVVNLVATAVSTSQIDLSWDDVAALSGETFDIERNGSVVDEDYAGAHTVGDPYEDTGLDPETEYTYRVRAVGGAVV